MYDLITKLNGFLNLSGPLGLFLFLFLIFVFNFHTVGYELHEGFFPSSLQSYANAIFFF